MQSLRFCLLAFCLVAPAAAQPDHTESYESRSYEDSSGSRLQYRLFQPADYDPSKRYPLVVYLHGAGGRGDDNLKQLTGGNSWGTSLFSGYREIDGQGRFPGAALLGDQRERIHIDDSIPREIACRAL